MYLFLFGYGNFSEFIKRKKMRNSKLEPLPTTFVSFFSPFDEFYLFGPSADAAFYFVTSLSVCKHFEIYYCRLVS